MPSWQTMSEKKSPPRKQEKTVTAKTPQSSKAESKSLKRKLFSAGATPSEDEEKKVTPKRRKSCAGVPEGSSSPGSTTPKTPVGVGRLTVPLSERQQMALLMQMTAETQGDTSPQPSSPQTPGSTLKKTPLEKKVNKRNDKGETPLHIAAIKGDYKSTKKLIKFGADVNIKDYAGWTPLHEACNHGCLDVAKQLLKAGANVNVQGLDNDTPLHDASINGHHKLVELLLKHGANPIQSNAKGKSALDIAASPDIKTLLKKEIITSSSESSGLDEARSPTSPESAVSDCEEDRTHESQELEFPSLPSSSSGRLDTNFSLSTSGTKRSPPSHYMKMDKFGSPRLTLKFQHIKSKDERRGRGTQQKLNKDPQYKSYSVTVESSEDYSKMFSPSNSSTSSQDSDLYDPQLDSTSSSNKRVTDCADRLVSLGEDTLAEQRSSSVFFHHQKLNIQQTKSEFSREENKVSSVSGQEPSSLVTSQFEDISDVEDGEEPMEVDTTSSSSLQIKLPISHTHIPDTSSTTDNQRTCTPMDTSEASPLEVTHVSMPSSSFSSVTTTTGPSGQSSTAEPSTEKSEKHKHKESHHKLEDSGNGAVCEKMHLSPKSDKDSRLSPKVEVRLSPNKDKDNRFSPKAERERCSPKPKFERELRGSTKSDKEKPSRLDRDRGSPKSVDSRDSKTSPKSDKESRWSPKSDSGKWEKLKIDTNRTSPGGEKDKEKLSPKSDKDRPSSPKVPPLKIILPQKNNSGEGGESLKALLMKPALPYVLNPTQEGEHSQQGARQSDNQTQGADIITPAPEAVSEADNVMSTLDGPDSTQQTQETAAMLSSDQTQSESALDFDKEKSKEHEDQQHQKPAQQQHPQLQQKKDEKEKEERRLTRSAVRSQQQQQAAAAAAAAANEAANHVQKDEKDKDKQKADSTEEINTNIHPRKRKLRHRQDQGTAQSTETHILIPPPPIPIEKPVNPFELYLDIRKQIAERRNNMFVVHPKAPQGFKDYLMVSCNYVLEGNSASRLAAPMLSPPNSVTGPMRELFLDQEKSRYRLRLQHVIEREKLMLSIEQEILRVHCRAARALANQNLPFSACTVLKHDEIYNTQVVDHEQHHDEKDKSVRSRYNGRQLMSWLQDVDDKYDKIKEALLLRHHHEAESLQAVQKLEWQWKVMEMGLSENKNSTPYVDDLHVPMVQVNDDFDLLPT